MHIYIDETGDTGFKLDKGSSQIFCITILIFNDPKEIEKVCQAIKTLQEKYQFKTGEEWKFSRTSPDRRIEFLKIIAPFNFRVQAVVMMKKNITGPNLTTDKKSFYNYTCKLVLKYALKSMKSVGDDCDLRKSPCGRCRGTDLRANVKKTAFPMIVNLQPPKKISQDLSLF